MSDVDARLRALGRMAGEVDDATADRGMVARVRRRLMSRARPRRRVPMWTLAAALLVATAVFVMWWPRSPTPVAFEVGMPPLSGQVGELVAAPASDELSVRFSEGSTLALSPKSRIRVTEVSPNGATMLLERGVVRVDVVSARDADWRVHAGPFTIAVRGTRFDASWDPAADTFDLVMHEGVVVITGPTLAAPRELAAGERLSVTLDESQRPSRASDDQTPVPSADTRPAPAVSSSAPDVPKPSWRALVADGKYREAMAALDGATFGALLSGGSRADLMLVADAARFAGQPARARDALLALRQRHGGAQSAFLLGKISADQLGAPADAARWFRTYLQEAPNGPLAEQALGRLLELSKRDAAGARRLAAEYLSRYPNGGYASLARSLQSP